MIGVGGMSRMVNPRTSVTDLKRTPRRRGAAAIEFAVVLPIFILAFIGILEFGRAVMIQQIITNAAREGARKAIRPGEVKSEVTTSVSNYLANTSANAASNTVALDYSLNPNATAPTWTTVDSLNSVPSQAAVRVKVSVKYSEVGWGLGRFLGSKTFSATVIMRRE